MGKRPNVVIKFATIMSSLLLVGGCVSYRSGLLDDASQTKSVQVEDQENSSPVSGATNDPVIFNGTKAPIRNSTFNFSTPTFGGYVPTISPTANPGVSGTKKADPAVFDGTKAPFGFSDIKP